MTTPSPNKPTKGRKKKAQNNVDTLQSEERTMVAKVYQFLRQEYDFTKLYAEPKCDISHLRNITQRTSEATGLPSIKKVQEILKEYRKENNKKTITGEKPKRRVIRSEGRKIIASVYHFLKEEYEFTKNYIERSSDFSHLANITQRTAEATGVSLKTVERVLKEEKQLPSPTACFPSPMANRKKRDNKVDIGESKADIVRSTIQKYYDVHKETPTLTKLRAILNEKMGFNGCLATLRNLLLKLGYEWKKKKSKRRVLTGPGLHDETNDSTPEYVDISNMIEIEYKS